MIAISTPRDFFMARIAAARSSAQGVIDACDEIIGLCIDPDEDGKLKKRAEELAEALEFSGATSRALESAEAMIDTVDPEAVEPWETEVDDDDDDEDDEPVLPRASARSRRSR